MKFKNSKKEISDKVSKRPQKLNSKVKNAIKVVCFVIAVIIAGVGSGYVYFTWDVGEFETIDGSEFGTVIITEYTGDATDVVIPNRLRGKKVISVDDYAFSETDITSVKIGDNVLSLGINVFYNCPKLQSVDMGKSLKSIGNTSFSDCPELTEIKLSPALESLGVGIFRNDAKLKTIDVGSNKNFKFEDGILYSADMTMIYEALKTADLSDFTMPETVNSLNGHAFYGQEKMTSIKLNDGITAIPEAAFADCKALTELVIPDSVTNIGLVVFSGSGIKTVKIPASVQSIHDQAFFNVEEQVTIVTTKGSYAEKYAKRNELKVQIVDSL